MMNSQFSVPVSNAQEGSWAKQCLLVRRSTIPAKTPALKRTEPLPHFKNRYFRFLLQLIVDTNYNFLIGKKYDREDFP